jgi:hypothetical protein
LFAYFIKREMEGGRDEECGPAGNFIAKVTAAGLGDDFEKFGQGYWLKTGVNPVEWAQQHDAEAPTAALCSGKGEFIWGWKQVTEELSGVFEFHERTANGQLEEVQTFLYGHWGLLGGDSPAEVKERAELWLLHHGKPEGTKINTLPEFGGPAESDEPDFEAPLPAGVVQAEGFDVVPMTKKDWTDFESSHQPLWTYGTAYIAFAAYCRDNSPAVQALRSRDAAALIGKFWRDGAKVGWETCFNIEKARHMEEVDQAKKLARDK